MPLHLIKLCVGCKSPDQLYQSLHRAERYAEGQTDEHSARHITRAFPRRAAEVLEGGSLYWVMDGLIRVRQSIIGLDRLSNKEDSKACAIVFSREIVLVAPKPRRPFQGWRYFPDDETPEDIGIYSGEPEATLSPETLRALADIGVF